MNPEEQKDSPGQSGKPTQAKAKDEAKKPYWEKLLPRFPKKLHWLIDPKKKANAQEVQKGISQAPGKKTTRRSPPVMEFDSESSDGSSSSYHTAVSDPDLLQEETAEEEIFRERWTDTAAGKAVTVLSDHTEGDKHVVQSDTASTGLLFKNKK